MKILDIGSWIQESTLIQRLPWWDLETEIDVLRSKLAANSPAQESIFLSALKKSEARDCALVELPIAELLSSATGALDDQLVDLEIALASVILAEGVDTVEDGLTGPRHFLAMDMIMREDEKTRFQQAGADISIIFQPECSLLLRAIIQVRPTVEWGYDFTAFEKSPSKAGRTMPKRRALQELSGVRLTGLLQA